MTDKVIFAGFSRKGNECDNGRRDKDNIRLSRDGQHTYLPTSFVQDLTAMAAAGAKGLLAHCTPPSEDIVNTHLSLLIPQRRLAMKYTCHEPKMSPSTSIYHLPKKGLPSP